MKRASCNPQRLLSHVSLVLGYHEPSHTQSDTINLEQVGEGFAITRIDLETEAEVPGMDATAFQQQAESAKKICPVSKALAGPQITLKAVLVRGK